MVAHMGLAAVISLSGHVGVWICKSSTILNHLNSVLSSDDISHCVEKLQFPFGKHCELSYK